MKDFVRIPEERLKKLKDSQKIKEQLEKITESKIEIGEEVSIECEDPLMLLRIKMVIQAFGRGFDLNDAMDLLDEDYHLETIDLRDYAGKSQTRIQTLKGRVIGSEGKTRNMIEKYTQSKISIYGKTISIIGRWDNFRIAKKAVEILLGGSMHTTVYRFLQEHKR